MNEPAALQLPDETWLEILAQGGLDYKDLKCVSMVCRRLNKLEKDSSLDSILFRALPTTIIKKGASVKVHPVLEDAWMSVVESDFAILLDSERDIERNVYELECAMDFATSPASKCLIIDMGKGLEIRREVGVTVWHVLKAVSKMWKEPAPKHMIRQKRFRRDPWDDDEEDGPITWAHLYEDCNTWTGWEKPKVRKDGEVTLKNREFNM
ncbi:hypothetical protein BCR35DRAFT_285467 [Leucosporidium creatinivorum]|uniref:F-box domain-containing protein n=1 Tax=Leucosporidium creatinivorum TaxID=106004 RepID=A0A1Y2C6R1_9BASI|nr:hypothetical protein BCR35DRAFT_285467 [Leucosporidium creatinivorum]